MTATDRNRFVYVTFIRTTPTKLWEALTEPRFMRQYWFDTIIETEWKKGSPWKIIHGDGKLTDTDEILEIDPPQRMILHWQNEWSPELKAEGTNRCTIELEPVDRTVKLTITHEIEHPDSKLITTVSDDWPRIMSNLKSLLKTNEIATTSHPAH